MMRVCDERTPEDSSRRYFDFSIATDQSVRRTFTFETPPLPEMHLTFPPQPPPRPRKRSRATTDIDGEHSCMQKKKRRLRLFLITSRLSPQYSHPATNIVDRGSSKIAVWAKQKSLGRNLLRKAAILNRVRRRAVSAREAAAGHGRSLVEQEREQEELKLARLEFNHGSVDTYTRPVTCQNPSVPPAAAVRTGGRFVVSGSPTGSPNSSRSPSPTSPSPPPKGIREESTSVYSSPNEAYAHSPPHVQAPWREHVPLPPSPLGLSNYDAFDADEDIPDPYSHLDDDDDDGCPTISFDNDDDDQDSIPFSPSAVTSTSSSTIQTRASQVLEMPPRKMFSDFSVLNYNEPVFGDYDQVDDGADTVWPSAPVKEVTTATIGSTSPDFNAVFATAPSKRSDSFAMSPNFRPTRPTIPVSPNFPPTSVSTSSSPNFTPSKPHASPNFPSSPVPHSSVSPNFAAPTTSSPNMTTTIITTSTSPNFSALDAPASSSYPFAHRRMSAPMKRRPYDDKDDDDDRIRRNSDTDQERKRQRDLLFARF